MFDLAARRLVWIPVSWPGVQPGEGEELASNTQHEIRCQVELLDKEAIKEVLGAESKLTELERFKRLVHDWRGVTNGGAAVPMTDENISVMLRVPRFSDGFE